MKLVYNKSTKQFSDKLFSSIINLDEVTCINMDHFIESDSNSIVGTDLYSYFMGLPKLSKLIKSYQLFKKKNPGFLYVSVFLINYKVPKLEGRDKLKFISIPKLLALDDKVRVSRFKSDSVVAWKGEFAPKGINGKADLSIDVNEIKLSLEEWNEALNDLKELLSSTQGILAINRGVGGTAGKSDSPYYNLRSLNSIMNNSLPKEWINSIPQSKNQLVDYLYIDTNKLIAKQSSKLIESGDFQERLEYITTSIHTPSVNKKQVKYKVLVY